MIRRAASGTIAGGAAALLGAVAAVLLGSGAVNAADWRLTPHVGATQIYSDNIDLAPSGQKQDDFVTTLNGGASIRGTGARLNLNLDYNMQVLNYHNDSSGDTIYHQLQGGAFSELYEDVLFLDLRGSVSQQNISSEGRLDNTNIARTGNTTNVVTYSVTPIVRHQFGRYAESEGRIGFDSVDTSGNAGTGTTRRMTFNMNSGAKFTNMPWTLATNNTKIDNDSGVVTRFRNIEATGRYSINRKYGVVASAGYEKNKFATLLDKNEGAIWSVGGIWTPSRRTEVEVGYRRRYFDPSYYFNASHRSRRAIFTASYNQDLTTSSQRLLADESFPLVDAFGDPILDPITGDQVSVPTDDSTLSEEVQLVKRFSASASYRGRLADSTVSVFSENRTFSLSLDEEDVYGVSMNVSRRMSRRSTLSVNGSWQRSDLADAGQDNDLWQIGGALSYQVSSDISASVDLRRLTRDGDGANDNYDEHRASLRVNVNF